MAWDVRTEVEESRGVSLVRESLPWTKSVEQLVPSSFANAVIPEDCPDESIEIDWIYGYQSERSRNNVRYNHQGNLVYPVGRYVIVYSFSAHAQKIFSTHTEEVTSLAMHPEGVLVATGEAGRTSRLMVWHSESMAIHFSDMTMHKDGILHITFSPDGKRLISVGNDPFHTMCVFYWEENRVLYTSQVHGNDCLGLAVLADNTLVAVGDSYIFFWTKSVEGYSKRKGIFTRTASIQPLTCVAQVGNVDTVVTGSQSGQLFIWIDCNCVRTIRGHEGAVTCVYSSSYGILSGGVDNRIRLWTHRFEPGASFDCSNLGPIPSIRSLCMSSDGTTILVGTRGACIFELSSVDGSDLRGGAIASGHFEGQVTGVSTHPNKLEFVTTGEDKQVRVIDLVTHTTLKLASFDTSVRAVAYAPAGDSIAVGLGGDSDKSKLGTYVILNERDMSIVHETRDSTSMVTRLVYSADGETLAVAFAEGTICLYGVHEDYDIVARYKSPSKRPITNIDFSVDGEVIRFNDIDNELTFFSIEKATVLTNYESLRDVQWSTCSSSQHWHTQSMHFVGFPGERVVCSQMANRDSLAVTCGTSLGYLRIHPFPITSHTAEYKRIAAHVGSVAEISYSNERTYLFSAGASDRCIVQWRRSNYMPGLGLAGAKFPDLQEAEDILLETRSGIEVFKDSMSYESAAPEGLLNADEYNGVPITLVNRNEPEINIWLQSVVTPANPAEQKLDIPPVSLKLEYVHGYRCVEMRNNLAYVSPSEIAFCAASVGVVMDRQSKSQKFYEVHTDMISAFAVSTDGKYCATGQSGATPKVTVWSTASCTLLVLVPDLQLHSVCSLAFSDNGEYLAVVSADENHTISIYNWRRQTVLSKFYMGVAHVFDICFTENDQSLFVCSTKDLMLWENVTSKVPISRRPMLAETGMWQPFLCCRPFNDSVLVGTADGSMYMFHDAILSMAVPAHRAALTAMDVNKHRMQVITGSKDGYVRVWNHLLECVHELKISRAIVSQNPCVTCVAFSMDGLHAVVGTQGAELFEMNTSIETPHTARPLLYGHGCRELWGLASHPTREEFATTGRY
jgi:microtubule-associated protein-like 6